MDEIFDTVKAIGEGAHPGLRLEIAALLDFTQVRLAELSSAEIARFVIRRRAMTRDPMTGPVAFVCADPGTFGMLRMFGILSELSGLRDERRTLVTTVAAEAFDWIARQAGLDESDTEQAARDLEQLPGWKDALGTP